VVAPRVIRDRRHNAQPSLNKALVVELAHRGWIEKRQNRAARKPSGTGKTHVGLALGRLHQT
jgi:IstB-like ATP binding protein